MKDLKYILAYSIPVTAVIGIICKSYWSFFTPVFAFVIMPICELLLPIHTANLDDKQRISKNDNSYFNILLYLNLPIVYGIVITYLWSITHSPYTVSEIIGLTISVGIVVGSNGINVAHELGHRKLLFEKLLGKALLIPALYMHFYIEHNYGHHIHAATKEDPASAQYNQTVYSFWVSSLFNQYINAWKIQHNLRNREGYSILSFKNDMLWYTLIQALYLISIYMVLGTFALSIAIAIAIIGAILLETINYIEHYGLSRKKTTSGRYERVTEIHSWNSNHILGRVMLYELTRHSDHHYKSHKKYQLLDYHDVSPQMPYGYPTSMVLSLFPPLWFKIMNKEIPESMKPS